MDWIAWLSHVAALIGAALGVWGIMHDFRKKDGGLTRAGSVAIAGLCIAALLALAAGIGSDLNSLEQSRQAEAEALDRAAELSRANETLELLRDETAQLRDDLSASESRERDLQKALTELAESQAVLLERNADIVVQVGFGYEVTDLISQVRRLEDSAPFLDWLVEEGRQIARSRGLDSELFDLCLADTADNCMRGEEGWTSFRLSSKIMQAAIDRFGSRNVLGTPTVFVVDLDREPFEKDIVCAHGFELVLAHGVDDASEYIDCPPNPTRLLSVYTNTIGIDALDNDGRDFGQNPDRYISLGGWNEDSGFTSLGFWVDVKLSGVGQLSDLAGRRLGIIAMNDVIIRRKNLWPEFLYSLDPYSTISDLGFSMDVTLKSGEDRVPLMVQVWSGQPLGRHSLQTRGPLEGYHEEWVFRGYAGKRLAMLVVDFPEDPSLIASPF